MRQRPGNSVKMLSYIKGGSPMIPVCHNLRRYANKVFKDIATDGKGTMEWCHGFKLHLLSNDSGETQPIYLFN